MNQGDQNCVGGGVTRCHSLFEDIVSVDNLFAAWREFRRGKMKKRDVAQFEFYLEDNIFQLHRELTEHVYWPQSYESFYVYDPKLRHIHKAPVRDRVVHQAIFRMLYPAFDRSFIYDSYSCRFDKGTHRGVKKLALFARKVSKNYRGPCYALKCDVKKFFMSIDRSILKELLEYKIKDEKTLALTNIIIQSYSSQPEKGLPLGNVTSQLFSNIYLNELDQFVKHQLKIKYYLRYCDDFLMLDSSRERLLKLIPHIDNFLKNRLRLLLHPKKITIRKLRQGIDFLGHVVLPNYIVLRTKTKRRMLRKLKSKLKDAQHGKSKHESFEASLNSYLGALSHGKNYRLAETIKHLK